MGRVWHTFCGWRPSEALTLSTVSSHTCRPQTKRDFDIVISVFLSLNEIQPWVCHESFKSWQVACHQSLSELLLYLAKRAATSPSTEFRAASGLKLSREDIEDLKRLNTCVVPAASSAVGVDESGSRIESRHHKQLRAQGRKWALHILEGRH